jgi:hypothetical protein
MIRVRRVGANAVHATNIPVTSRPSDTYGRMVRVLLASKVRVACGITLESSDTRPILVLRYAGPVSCRACRRAMTTR